jgi:membrane protein YqaA with SNARE-associated domain
MRAFFFSVLGYFLTPVGVVLMGVLDASFIFFLPLGIDFVVIVMAARHPETFWVYALLAALGSVIGAAVTYWVGRIVGEKGLTRFVNPSRLERVKARVSGGAAVTVAALAIVPPPFPFTAFVLTSGALEVNPWAFFPTLTAMRLARFGAETALASHYGAGILRWTRTPTFQAAVIVLAAIAVIGTVASIVALVRSRRT